MRIRTGRTRAPGKPLRAALWRPRRGHDARSGKRTRASRAADPLRRAPRAPRVPARSARRIPAPGATSHSSHECRRRIPGARTRARGELDFVRGIVDASAGEGDQLARADPCGIAAQVDQSGACGGRHLLPCCKAWCEDRSCVRRRASAVGRPCGTRVPVSRPGPARSGARWRDVAPSRSRGRSPCAPRPRRGPWCARSRRSGGPSAAASAARGRAARGAAA